MFKKEGITMLLNVIELVLMSGLMAMNGTDTKDFDVQAVTAGVAAMTTAVQTQETANASGAQVPKQSGRCVTVFSPATAVDDKGARYPEDYEEAAQEFLVRYINYFKHDKTITTEFIQKHMQACIEECDKVLGGEQPSDRLLHFMYPGQDMGRQTRLMFNKKVDGGEETFYAWLVIPMDKFHKFSTAIFNAQCEREVAADLKKDRKEVSEQEKVAWTASKGQDLLKIIINVAKKLAQTVLEQLKQLQ